MGLDLALAGLVLVTAIRGWLKGFMVQAIRLLAFVASVYVAAPLRDEIKSRAIQYFPTIPPQITDQLLWWVSLVLSYVLMVGVASLALAIARRQTYGNGERGRGDQFAGFGLSLIKGAILAAFLLASVQKYGETYVASFPVAQEQTRESIAWKLNSEYQPANKLWKLPPVQLFVNQILQMGWKAPDSDASKDEVSARTESRSPKLELNARRNPQAGAREDQFSGDLDAQFQALQNQLKAISDGLK